jgi:hypothetical protein
MTGRLNMAKLVGRVELPEEDYSNYFERRKAGLKSEHEKAFEALCAKADALPKGTIEGAILKFPHADGYALYLVSKDTGRTVELKHIPYGDAWQVHPALIRGLSRKDIVRQVEGERRLTALFADAKKKQRAIRVDELDPVGLQEAAKRYGIKTNES